MGDLEEEEPLLEALPFGSQHSSCLAHVELEDEEPACSEARRALLVDQDDELLRDEAEARDEADFDRMLERDIKAAEAYDPLANRMGLMAQERQLAKNVKNDLDQELWKDLDDFGKTNQEYEQASQNQLDREEGFLHGNTTDEELADGGGGLPRAAVPQRGQGEETAEHVDFVGMDDRESLEQEEVYRKKLEASLEDHLCELRIEEQQRSEALLQNSAGPCGLSGCLPPQGVAAYGNGDIAGGE